MSVRSRDPLPSYSVAYPCVLWYSEMLRVRGEKEVNSRWLAQFLMSNPRILGYGFCLSNRAPAQAWSACLGQYEHWPNCIAAWKRMSAEMAEQSRTPQQSSRRAEPSPHDYPPNPKDELCQQAERDFVDASRLMHDVSAVEALETPENRPLFMDYNWLVSQYGKIPWALSEFEQAQLFRSDSPSRAVGARLSAESER